MSGPTGACLVVVEPGVGATLQDLGRYGRQRDGVPPCGALDVDGLRLASALVGAPAGQAAIECRFLGPTVRAEGGPVRVALAGADATMRVRRAAGDEEAIDAWRSVTLEPGDLLRVGPLRRSATGYLAAAGGFDVAPTLGSRATFLRGGFGGVGGRGLETGDRLAVGGGALAGPETALPEPPDPTPPARVRVVLGPQDDYFTSAAIETFLSATWTITKNADRMGVRLDGPRLEHGRGADIVSDGIVSGAVQVPGAGLPILLLADRQTSGGYPKMAAAITADLPALGRMGPGHAFRIEAVSAVEGARILSAKESALARLIGTIGPLRAAGGLDLEALYSENLISGPIDD